jgi:predicted ester cyclase
MHHIEGDKLLHSYVLLDLLDLMRQAGIWPIAPSLGTEELWTGPATEDGVELSSSDSETGQQGFATVMAMHAALGSFDGKSINSMRHGQYWTENFAWYGPSGIGTTYGMDEFRAHHQIPFLNGFPDRKGSGHYVRIADGDYVVTGGWPSVVGTHSGEWLGLPATGRSIEMRVMDFYRLEGNRIAENWVPIDIIHIVKQMGYDIFVRLKHLGGAPARELPTP